MFCELATHNISIVSFLVYLNNFNNFTIPIAIVKGIIYYFYIQFYTSVTRYR